MIKFEQVTKKFPAGKVALEEISFEVKEKEFVFLTGPSGAGKTTIFNLLIGSQKPTSGSIKYQSFKVEKLPKKMIPLLRSKIGIVFQELKLLYDRSVYENVSLALEVLNYPKEKIYPSVKHALEIVGLWKSKDKFPIQLSGGELQRTAIARAMVKNPEVLLADEPTADLDPAKSWEIIKLLNDINHMGTTVILATHNIEIVNSFGKRVIGLLNGKIVKDEKKGKY